MSVEWGRTELKGVRRLCCAILCLVLFPQSVLAEGPPSTPPGTRIANTAMLTWREAGRDSQSASNTVALVVAERLDVALARNAVGPVPADGAAAVSVRLTNLGNGLEAFAVTAAAASAGVVVAGLAIDRDDDGRFDPARDTPLEATTPVLAAGASLSFLVLLASGARPDGAILAIEARASTGSGEPGRVLAAAGDGGGDAVVGATGAVARILVPVAAVAAAAPTLVKAQAVRAADGSTRAASGAVVTYTLTARFPAAARDARIEDPLPAGTAFVAGSLHLDDVPLTDAADGDAGNFDGARIAVALGDPAAGVTRIVAFQVRLP